MSVLESIQYQLLKTELEISENGIFFGIYRDEDLKHAVIEELEKTVPSCRHISPREDICSLFFSERVPGNHIFWISPEVEKQFFSIFPELYHSGITVFDFSGSSRDLRQAKQGALIGSAELSLSVIEKFSIYLEKSLPQYEHLYYIPSYFTNRKGKTFLLDDLIKAFLSDKANTNLLIIAGDHNAGKTLFFLHCFAELSEQFLKEPHKKRFPVMVSLDRHSESADIDSILLKEFYETCGVEFSSDNFRELYRKGKFVFLIDGFDEMSRGMTAEKAADIIGQIYRLACENDDGTSSLNKVMMTCAPHYIYNHFKNGRPVNSEDHTIFYQEYAPKRDTEAVCINPKELDDEQLKAYLVKTTQDGISARNLFGILKDRQFAEEISDLYLLKQMIIQTTPMLHDKKEITPADIYRVYSDMWIKREDWRSELTPEGKKIFLSELSLAMFQKCVPKLQDSELPVSLSEYTREKEKQNRATPEDMKFCPFLNCDEEGNYSFVHPSFLGYFLAEYYFDRIKNKQQRLFPPNKLNKAAAYFLKMIISSEKTDLAGLDMSGLDLEKINLYRANLNGSNLNKCNLRSAELMGAVLSEADLTGADLSKASLTRANFHNADLSGTDMSRTRLRDAELRTARLNGANFTGADMTGAKLSGAKLTFTGLSEADLSRADMSSAILNDADMSGAKLCQANLNKADLSGANLSDADLTDADMVEAVLVEADLRGAKLVMANMTWAKLSKADMSHANLNRARLREADLTETDFHQASLNQADLRWAKIDKAKFIESKLREAHFTGASITEAAFHSADLAWANFTGAVLKASDFSNAILNMAKFREADMSYSKFIAADMTWADMSKANLYKADLSSAILVEADFKEADLRASKLNHANLSGADFKQAKLDGADLTGTDLDEKTER